jgi:hypothetical protein
MHRQRRLRATGIEVTGPDELAAGESATLQATVTPSSVPNKTVLWSVDDEDAASITSAGLLTALDVDAATEVTVTATAADGSEAYGTWLVTILPRPASVSIRADGEDLDSATIYLTETPPALQLTASVEPEDARQAVTWSSSDSAVATISAAGLVTAHRRGQRGHHRHGGGHLGRRNARTDRRRSRAHAYDACHHRRVTAGGGRPGDNLDAGRRGDGDIGYDVTVLKDGEDTDAEPDVTGSTVTFTPDESGTYQLRVTASNQFDNEDTMTGGDATACELSLSTEADSIALGGQVTSGSFGSFGPRGAALRTRIEYAWRARRAPPWR